MPETVRASWIRWGIGLSLGLPAIAASVFLVTSLMGTRLTSRHDVPPFLTFSIMLLFALAAAGISAWYMIARALRDAGPRSVALGLALAAASCVLCAVVAGIQDAANPREAGGGAIFVALSSAFGLAVALSVPLALVAVLRARRAGAHGRLPHD